ncbi:MAG: TetR/AcrR family transcriptional regulator [Dermatophilaceae bacterium]
MPYHHGNLRAALLEAGVELARERGPDGVVLREVARRTSVSHNAAYRHFAHREALLAEIAAHGAAQLEAAMVRRLATVPDDAPAPRARRRLREIGRAYVEFALAEPGLFAVSFSADAHPLDGPRTQGAANAGEPTGIRATGKSLPSKRIRSSDDATRATGGGPADMPGTGTTAADNDPAVAGTAGAASDSTADQPAPYVLLGQVLDELVEAGAMEREHRPGADTACWSAVHGFAVLHLTGPRRHAPPAERDADLEALLDTIDRGLTA